MNIAGVSLDDYSIYQGLTNDITQTNKTSSFDSLYQSALGMVSESNELSNQAEEEEIKYATGASDNLHTLQVAQQKANVSLQYTVAVKNTALEAYKSILNMQF